MGAVKEVPPLGAGLVIESQVLDGMRTLVDGDVLCPEPGPVSMALPNSLWTSGLNTSGTPNRSFLRPGEPT